MGRFACCFAAASLAAVAHGHCLAHTQDSWSAEHFQPSGQAWNLHLDDASDGRVLQMPQDAAKIPGLTPAERKAALRQLREHELNKASVLQVAKRFSARIAIAHPHMRPEYERSLAEVFVAVSRLDNQSLPSLDRHIPLLEALPPYTRIVVSTPATARTAVLRQLSQLHLQGRSQVIVDRTTKSTDIANPWARDMLLVVDAGQHTILATPLRFQPRGSVQHSDLSHLSALQTSRRELLRTPLYYRSGNLLLARRKGSRLLFVGEGELFLNAIGYVNAHLARPRSEDTLAAFRELTGADRVVVLPNTDRLFHLDQYMAPLADDVIAFLNPLDFARLAPDEQYVLRTARRQLEDEGFRLVFVPTLSERINASQSPVNLLPFRDLRDGRPSALVPRFPDRMLSDGKQQLSLNEAIANAYRSAGVRVIPVDDRFWPLMGNTHCVAVALR